MMKVDKIDNQLKLLKLQKFGKDFLIK